MLGINQQRNRTVSVALVNIEVASAGWQDEALFNIFFTVTSLLPE